MKDYNRSPLMFLFDGKELPAEEQLLLQNTPYTLRSFPKDSIIAAQGKEVRALYALLSGKVRSEMITARGDSLYVGKMKAPFLLASIFLFSDGGSFPVAVTALGDVEIAFYQKEQVDRLLAQSPAFRSEFLKFTALQFQTLSNRLQLFSMKSILQKLVFHILSSSSDGVHFCFTERITDLASYFGVRRQSLSRILSQLSKNKLITFDNGKGTILDRQGLKNLI